MQHRANDTSRVVNGGPGNDTITGDEAYQTNTTLVSEAIEGGVANAASFRPVISPDGKLVMFSSLASNLVAGDTENSPDLFIRNLETGEIVQINLDADGNRLPDEFNHLYYENGAHIFAPDGKSVYILTDRATIYRKDLGTGELTKVFQNPDGSISFLDQLSVSADGQTLFFRALHTPYYYFQSDIFSFDLQDQSVRLISTNYMAQPANRGASNYSVSGDGQWAAFISVSTDFASDNNTLQGAYLKNLQTGEVRTLSPSIDAMFSATFYPSYVEVSNDGKKVLLVSTYPGLTADDSSRDCDIFLYDIATATMDRISAKTHTGYSGINDYMAEARFIGDTYHVAYVTYSTDPVSGNDLSLMDIMMIDAETGVTRALVYDYRDADYISDLHLGFTFSADGTRMAFADFLPLDPMAGTHTADDHNMTADVFVVDTFTLPVYTGDDILKGGGGNDVLTGLGGADRLDGGDGEDRLDGGIGNDELTGGIGNDTYVFSYGFGRDTVRVDTGGEDAIYFAMTGPVFYYTLEIEIVGNDVYIASIEYDGPASTQQNYIFIENGLYNPIERIVSPDSLPWVSLKGGANSQTLTGGDGDDMLDGGAGEDSLRGGAGNDSYYVDNAGDTITELAEGGHDIVWSSINLTLGGDVEDLRLMGTATSGTGNSLNNFILGNAQANTLAGQVGDDFLIGGVGHDTLNGGDGDDFLRGDEGADRLDGGNGIDIARYDGAASGVVVRLVSGQTHEGAAVGDVLISIEGVVGTAFDDRLYGDDTANRLWGGQGDDILEGGAGRDYLDGGNGIDIADYRDAAAGIRLGQLSNDPLAEPTTDILANIEIIWGSDHNDVIQFAGETYGYGGNDVLYGRNVGDLGDLLDGGTGIDTLNGGRGNDTYIVDELFDVITDTGGVDLVISSTSYGLAANLENLTLTGSEHNGGTGNNLDNIIIGNFGSNVLQGLRGDDYLDGGAGADAMLGFEDNDTYVVDVATEGVIETANNGTDLVLAWVSFALSDHVENLTLLTGAADATGNGLNNFLTGNSGHNRLDGVLGADTMTGGQGNDTYVVDNIGDIVVESANSGRDAVESSLNFSLAGTHIETLTLMGMEALQGTGNAFANTLIGNANRNRLDGGDGNDILDGGLGSDSLIGGRGDDTYYVDHVNDQVVEKDGEGVDTIYASLTIQSAQFVENVTLIGTGHLNAHGNALNNILTGNIGNNVLNGGTGADRMIGGLGNDTYYIDHAGDRVSEIEGEGTDAVVSSVTVSVAAWAVENVTLNGSANIDITANALDNILTGNSGHNSFNGRGGADSMIGGLGNDTYYVDNALDRVRESDGQGTDTVFSTVSFSVAAQAVENVILTGSAGIEAIGNSLANVLTGNGGNNSLNGRVGADTLIGGGGHDIYYVDNLGDMVNELAGQGVDTIVTSLSYSLAGLFVEKLTLNGSAGNSATGNAFNNIITGNNGNNLIDGGAGADRMYGALGNDTFIIDDVNDKPTEKAGEGYDTLMTGITFSVAAQAIEAIILTGSGHIDMVANPLDNVITGNSGNNVINGRSGHDTIDGGAGNDTLIGSTGNDILTGGLGADIFLFSKKPGTDTITDFSKAQGDTINLNDITAGFNTASIVTQSGSDVIIDFGGGHILTIEDAVRADVLTQNVW